MKLKCYAEVKYALILLGKAYCEYAALVKEYEIVRMAESPFEGLMPVSCAV